MHGLKKLSFFASLYIGIFILFSGIFFLLLHTPLFLSQHVLFYRGMFLLVCTWILMCIILIGCSRKKWRIYTQSFIAALMIATSIHITLFVLLPVTFDRSVTMFLLESLEHEKRNVCGGLTKSDMEQHVIDGYVMQNDAVAKRIDEQMTIDMIQKKNECYGVTPTATVFLQFSSFVKHLYGVK